MKVRYSYLPQKFKGCMDPGHPIYEGFKELLSSGDFTLGKAVQEFETSFAELIGAKHAIGVANGTDAIRIGLRAVGVGPGDEVITASNTFVASAGAIVELFATPRFVDMGPWFTLDANLLERAITKKTKAIVPVHFAGQPVEMDTVMHVARKHGIPVVEDACQAVLAEHKDRCCGTIGDVGAFSLHPLKNLNVFGDGGMITTNDTALYEKIKLYRNHGLKNRDEIASFGCNSRLDSLQAIVGNYLIKETKDTVAQRRANAAFYDSKLEHVTGIEVTTTRTHTKPCYHLYIFQVAKHLRNDLVRYLVDNGIEAKVHYPIPLQGVLQMCGGTREEFPRAFEQSDRIVSLPVDEHLTCGEMEYTVKKVAEFMSTQARTW